MNNDRHGESCAREVGARVDESDARNECASRVLDECDAAANGAVQADARPIRGTAARHNRESLRQQQRASSRATTRGGAAFEQVFTSDWNAHQAQLLRAFFRDAGSLAARYRVSADDLVAHVRDLSRPQLERGLLLKPVVCVGDLAVAAACCLGRANAWNELWVFAEPSMTRAAFSRLPETLALTWTRRYWTQLQRATREDRAGLARYDGSRPIRLWIVEQLLGTLEAERAAGRLEIRREQLGRPIPLRLVGQQLA